MLENAARAKRSPATQVHVLLGGGQYLTALWLVMKNNDSAIKRY
jgi:hypothetical protein